MTIVCNGLHDRSGQIDFTVRAVLEDNGDVVYEVRLRKSMSRERTHRLAMSAPWRLSHETAAARPDILTFFEQRRTLIAPFWSVVTARDTKEAVDSWTNQGNSWKPDWLDAQFCIVGMRINAFFDILNHLDKDQRELFVLAAGAVQSEVWPVTQLSRDSKNPYIVTDSVGQTLVLDVDNEASSSIWRNIDQSIFDKVHEEHSGTNMQHDIGFTRAHIKSIKATWHKIEASRRAYDTWTLDFRDKLIQDFFSDMPPVEFKQFLSNGLVLPSIFTANFYPQAASQSDESPKSFWSEFGLMDGQQLAVYLDVNDRVNVANWHESKASPDISSDVQTLWNDICKTSREVDTSRISGLLVQLMQSLNDEHLKNLWSKGLITDMIVLNHFSVGRIM